MRVTRHKWKLLVLGAAAGWLGLAAISDVPLCALRNILGLPCPGCGISRATLALVLLDFREAFRLQPLVFVLVPIAVAVFLRPQLCERLSKRPRLFGALVALVLVLIVVVWIVRLSGGLGGLPDPIVWRFGVP